MRITGALLILISLTLIAGCSDGFSGTYADEGNVTRYTFAENGDVRISVLGAEIDAQYRVDGDKVLVSSAQGTVVLTLRDEHLYGPMGLRLEPQNK